MQQLPNMASEIYASITSSQLRYLSSILIQSSPYVPKGLDAYLLQLRAFTIVEILKYSLLSAQVCLHKYDDFYDIICFVRLILAHRICWFPHSHKNTFLCS
jgi:hypothetical protein